MNASRSSFGKARPHVVKAEPGVTRIAAVQLASGPNVKGNLDEAGRLIEMAVAQGAKLVALPEYFAIMGLKDNDKVKAREKLGAGPIQQFLSSTARRHGVWLVGGSVPLECASPDKVRNTCLVYDVVTVETPFARLGLSICYDLRFPELYRAMKDVDIILVPSAFTETTGKAHWETLIRARAIENLAYVLAPAQGGYHLNGRETHGDSMIVDPWGVVLDRLARGSGVVVAGINLQHLKNLRQSLPALSHRTLYRC